MRRIAVITCKPGMVLAKPIYNEVGRTLIGKDVEMTQNLINKLLDIGIESVYIQDSRTDDIMVEDALSEKTRENALGIIKDTFKGKYQEKLIDKPLISDNLSMSFRSLLSMIIDDLKGNSQAMLMLSSIYVKDTYLYNHSLNVSLYSISMGMGLGLKHQQLVELGLGALLHDIGKTRIPLSVLEKKEKLTDEEFSLIKNHSEFGFEILRKEIGIPLPSAHCAYQHHERINGSGYPRGLVGNNIHKYSKIVAIADVYDAIVSERVYKKPKLPHEALELLFTGVNQDFDKEMVEAFKKNIAIYPIGTGVKLSSGEFGVVVNVNNVFPARPIIRILENSKGNKLEKPYEVDMSKELSKIIVECNIN